MTGDVIETTFSDVGEHVVKLTVTDDKGAYSSATATISVRVPPPVVSVAIEPDAVKVGGLAVLNWSATNVDAVTIDNGIGVMPGSGSVVVSPATSTTYTITASNPSWSSSAEVRLVVLQCAPTGPLWVDQRTSPLAEAYST